MTLPALLHDHLTDHALSAMQIIRWWQEHARCVNEHGNCAHYRPDLGTCGCKERAAMTNQWVEMPEKYGCIFWDDKIIVDNLREYDTLYTR